MIVMAGTHIKGKKGGKAGAGKRGGAVSPSRWTRFMAGLMCVVSSVVSSGLLLSAYAGFIPPSKFAASALMCMTFPAWMALSVLILIVNLIWWRRWAVISVAALLLCAGPLWDNCPLNLPHGRLTADEQKRAFTIMTYNVSNFYDLTESYPGGINPTISYILREDPDIVCMQELEYFSAYKYTMVTAEQIDSLHRRYPFVVLNGHTQGIMSKYPVEPLRLDFKYGVSGGGDMAAYRVLIEGEPVNIFNLHLGSFLLTKADKKLYKDVTKLDIKDNAGELKMVKDSLLRKVMRTAVNHENQAEQLIRYIKRYGGPRTIVCGDFNDVPGSYVVRRLDDVGMRQVYSRVGFGPMLTFHANRFYFRIDHVLYRGALEPVKLERHTVPYSDHYPLITTFLIEPQP